MRGLLLSISLALAMAPAFGGAEGGETAAGHASSEFRLLELGGRNVRWKLPENGLPATITYAFLTEPAEFPGARNCDAMLPPKAALGPSRIADEDFRREVRAAFAAWEEAANIVFRETASSAEAGILIGADAKARGRAFTNVALEEQSTTGKTASADPGAIRQSLICLNPKRHWKIGFDGDLDIYDLRFTMMHEIGHAIGLDHPGPEGPLMGFRYVERSRTLQTGDVAGAMALYGRPGAPAPALNVAASPEPSFAGEDTAFGLGEAPAASR